MIKNIKRHGRALLGKYPLLNFQEKFIMLLKSIIIIIKANVQL